MGVIIGYASYLESSFNIDSFAKPVIQFVNDYENDEFITCHYIVDKDIPKFQKRRQIIRNEIRKKLRNPQYEIQSEELHPKDIEWGNKIYELKDKLSGGELQVFQLLVQIDSTFDARIDYFLNNHIKNVVVPIETIDETLRVHFQSIIKNRSDAHIIASAIQYNTIKPIHVVTTDKGDFWKLQKLLELDYKLSQKYKAPKVSFIKDLI